MLYLNADVETARANAVRTYEGEAFGLFDLNPTMRPHLQIVTVAPCRAADALSEAGLAALGLPASYPDGIGYDVCQPIGKAVHDAKIPGVACRSAALAGGEELALFDQRMLSARLQRLVFDQWFLERVIS